MSSSTRTEFGLRDIVVTIGILLGGKIIELVAEIPELLLGWMKLCIWIHPFPDVEEVIERHFDRNSFYYGFIQAFIIIGLSRYVTGLNV